VPFPAIGTNTLVVSDCLVLAVAAPFASGFSRVSETALGTGGAATQHEYPQRGSLPLTSTQPLASVSSPAPAPVLGPAPATTSPPARVPSPSFAVHPSPSHQPPQIKLTLRVGDSHSPWGSQVSGVEVRVYLHRWHGRGGVWAADHESFELKVSSGGGIGGGSDGCRLSLWTPVTVEHVIDENSPLRAALVGEWPAWASGGRREETEPSRADADTRRAEEVHSFEGTGANGGLALDGGPRTSTARPISNGDGGAESYHGAKQDALEGMHMPLKEPRQSKLEDALEGMHMPLKEPRRSTLARRSGRTSVYGGRDGENPALHVPPLRLQLAADADILVVLEGTMHSTGLPCVRRRCFRARDIRVGHAFAPIVAPPIRRTLWAEPQVDFDNFHTTAPVSTH